MFIEDCVCIDLGADAADAVIVGHDHARNGNEEPSAMHSRTLMPFGFFAALPG